MKGMEKNRLTKKKLNYKAKLATICTEYGNKQTNNIKY